jgi:putative transposase
VLLKLAYLGVSNVFAMLRLLPMSDRDKDAETLLALRHQIAVLQRPVSMEVHDDWTADSADSSGVRGIQA